MEFTLENIIELNVSQLSDLIIFQEDKSGTNLHLYAKAIHSYLNADCKSVEDILNQTDPSEELWQIINWRLRILRCNYDAIDIKRCVDDCRLKGVVKGEFLFVLGTAALRVDSNELASILFKKSYGLLWNFGSKRKGVKSFMNHLVAESRLDNRRRLVSDYLFLIEKAKEVGDSIVEGLCIHNISKEYQILGAYELALDYSQKSLDLLKNDFGSLHYFEAVLQKCHILIDLGRIDQAFKEFQKAKASPHPQTMNALCVIEKMLAADFSKVERVLEPAWKSKLKNLQSSKKAKSLTKTEVVFIKLLSKEPLVKDEIIKKMYGENIDWMSAKNRFDVFLSRFRKKYPSLISVENETIQIDDVSFVSSFGNAV